MTMQIGEYKMLTIAQYGCRAGEYFDAFHLIGERINRESLNLQDGSAAYSIRRFGLDEELLSALQNFFEEPWDKPIGGVPVDVVSSVRVIAGFCYYRLGRLSLSEILWGSVRLSLGRQKLLFFRPKTRMAYHTAYGRQIMINFEQGKIDSARELVARQFALHGATELWDWPVFKNFAYSARAHFLSGDFEQAAEGYEKAENWQAFIEPQYPRLDSFVGFEFCELLLQPIVRLVWQLILGVEKEIPRKSLKILDVVNRRAKNSLIIVSKEKLPHDTAMDLLTLAKVEVYNAILFQESKIPVDTIERLDEIVKAFSEYGMMSLIHYWCAPQNLFHVI